jgi:hypothetical protein
MSFIRLMKDKTHGVEVKNVFHMDNEEQNTPNLLS